MMTAEKNVFCTTTISYQVTNGLLECNAVYFVPLFWRNVLPFLQGRRWRQDVHLKCWCLSTSGVVLHSTRLQCSQSLPWEPPVLLY